MNIEQQVMSDLAAALALAAPAPVTVTRTMQDFAERADQQLVDGVITLLQRGVSDQFMDVLVVGQVKVAESVLGEDLDTAESSLLEKVRLFADHADGAQVILRDVRFSMQLERPYGWFSTVLRVGPFDFTPQIDTSGMDPFIEFHADWDIAQPDGDIDATDIVLPEQ